VSDLLDRRFGSRCAAVALAAVLLVAGCQPLTQEQLPPVPPDGGTPCNRALAVESDTVVISAGACNPWCIHVRAGTPVYFINNDPGLYFFLANPALLYEDVQVPGGAGTVTLPLPPGMVTWTAAHTPAATVTVFVE
jgi:hypothetical protein